MKSQSTSLSMTFSALGGQFARHSRNLPNVATILLVVVASALSAAPSSAGMQSDCRPVFAAQAPRIIYGSTLNTTAAYFDVPLKLSRGCLANGQPLSIWLLRAGKTVKVIHIDTVSARRHQTVHLTFQSTRSIKKSMSSCRPKAGTHSEYLL